MRRLLARYRAPDGPASLVHGNAGRRPANRVDPRIGARLVELALTTYAGVNRAHLADLLAGGGGGPLVPERTLRRILAEAGLPWSGRDDLAAIAANASG